MIPIIDLAKATEGSVDGRLAVAGEIDRACHEVGFFTVVGHEVDDETVEGLHRQAIAFFNLPLGDRLAVAMPEPGYPYGYKPVGGRGAEPVDRWSKQRPRRRRPSTSGPSFRRRVRWR